MKSKRPLDKPRVPRHLRIPAEIDKALLEAAEKQDRDVSGQATVYLRAGLKADGFLLEE